MRLERVVVTGGRRFNDGARIEADLRALLPLGLRSVAHGAARGADALVESAVPRLVDMTNSSVFEVGRYPADWHGDGKAAGPRRNIHMLEAEKPDIVLAYPDPDSRGTWHCVAEALARGVPVVAWMPWAAADGLGDFMREVCAQRRRIDFGASNFAAASVSARPGSPGRRPNIDEVERALEAVR